MIGQTDLKLVREEKLTRPEIDTLKNKVAALEAQETPTLSTYLQADGTITGATSSPQPFTLPIIAPWVDYPLGDTTNGSHFNDNTGNGTMPAGWTQGDAAQAMQVNSPYGFWTITGASGEASWAFRRQIPSGFNIESLGSNVWKSFLVGPILLRDSGYTADVNYYFGIYRNNAGSIDQNTFARININWSSASSIWQIRGERKDGTTQTNGTYVAIARAPVPALWLRVALQNATNKPTAIYFGGVPFVSLNTLLMSANVGSVTWGQAWWQFSMSRGAGADDRVLIGGIDYSGDS